MTPYKNRKIDYAKPVYVYRNLGHQTKHLYSIRQFGLVVAHADRFVVEDADFIINQAGAKRVRKEKRKNVHAYVYGYLRQPVEPERILYNPYTGKGFVSQETGKTLKGAPVVHFNEMGLWAYSPRKA